MNIDASSFGFNYPGTGMRIAYPSHMYRNIGLNRLQRQNGIPGLLKRYGGPLFRLL